MACNWLMLTSSGDNNWSKELRNGLQLADDDIIRGGLDIVKNKTFNKRKNRALLTLRRSQKHYEIFSKNVLRKDITRKQLRLETLEIA